MARLATLAVISSAAFLAIRFDLLQGFAEKLVKSTEKDAENGQLFPASTPPIDPQGVTKEEAILAQHSGFLHPFAAANIDLTAAIMWQESRGNETAMGPVIAAGANVGDRAHGLMQVMPITAEWLHDDLGYNRILATPENLRTAQGSIYFGTAYMEWLNDTRQGRNAEWLIRSYNGGPGWTELLDGPSKDQNDTYYRAVLGRWQYLKGE